MSNGNGWDEYVCNKSKEGCWDGWGKKVDLRERDMVRLPWEYL